MGTDVNGRDVLARLLYGFRYSFAFAFSVWLFSSVIGIVIGATMGYLAPLSISLASVAGSIRVPAVFSPADHPDRHFYPTSSGSFCSIRFLAGWVSASICGGNAQTASTRVRRGGQSVRGEYAAHRVQALPGERADPVADALTVYAVRVDLDAGRPGLLRFRAAAADAELGELFNQAQQYFRIAWWLAFFPAGACLSRSWCST